MPMWVVLWTTCKDNCLEEYSEHQCFRTNGVVDHWTAHDSYLSARKLYKSLILDSNVLMANICDPIVSTDFTSPSKYEERKERVKG